MGIISQAELILLSPFLLLLLVAVSRYRKKGTKDYIGKYLIWLFVTHLFFTFIAWTVFVHSAYVQTISASSGNQTSAQGVKEEAKQAHRIETARQCASRFPTTVEELAADQSPMFQSCGDFIKTVYVRWIALTSVMFGVIGFICALLQLVPDPTSKRTPRPRHHRF